MKKGKEDQKCRVQLYKEGRAFFVKAFHQQILKSTRDMSASFVSRSFVRRIASITSSWKCRIIALVSIVDPHCTYWIWGLVGALSLNMAWLLAFVASTLTGGLGGAISGQVTDFATVVALLTLGAVT